MSSAHARRAIRRTTRLPSVEVLEGRMLLANFTVVNTDDDGGGSLRQAILNANSTAGTDTILFDIPGPGVQTIRPATGLPTITDPVTIDGYTQPGSRPNTNPVTAGSNALLLIQLDGTLDREAATGQGVGLRISAGGSTVRGLVINRFMRGSIAVETLGVPNTVTPGGNTFAGNVIGLNPAGTTAFPDPAGVRGIFIILSSNNTIGGTAPADRNIISGSNGGDFPGILIGGDSTTTGNVIRGNFIGTDATGTVDLGNQGGGVRITGAAGVAIGGTVAGAGNVIAFNRGHGVGVAGVGNSILGNSIFENRPRGIAYSTLVVNPPVLTSATATSVAGTLNGPANTAFRLELFATPPVPGSTATPQGKTFLGTADVTTDGAGNASFTINPPGRVPAGQSLTVTATNPAGSTSEFSATVTIPVATAADLSVAVTDAPDPVTVGGNLTYTITVTNAGPAAATGVTLTDTLPAGVTFVSATGGVTPVGNTLTFNLGSLAAGGVGASVTVVVRPTTAGTITGRADVSAAEADPNAANNTDAETTAVNPAAAVADLAVTVADAPDPANVGQDLTYTIIVTNRGPDAATGVTLRDFPLPSGATFVSTSRGGFDPATGAIVAALGSLANGASTTVTIVVRPTAAAAGRTLVNTVNVTANEADPVPTNNRTRGAATVVNAGADLSVSLVASPSPATVGRNLTYTLTVRNNGPDVATGVTLAHTLPASVTFVSATGGITPVNGVLTFNIGALGPAAAATVTIVVTPTVARTLTNSIGVRADQVDPEPTNNTATRTADALVPGADLSVSITAASNRTTEAGNLIYTLTVRNNGPDVATGVTLNVAALGRAFIVPLPPSQGRAVRSPAGVRALLGSIARGASATVRVTTVTLRPARTLTAVARVTGAVPDLNPANDAIQTVTVIGLGAPAGFDTLRRHQLSENRAFDAFARAFLAQPGRSRLEALRYLQGLSSIFQVHSALEFAYRIVSPFNLPDL
jgi:uncharacterized repeat protein (TIGR01451 family)